MKEKPKEKIIHNNKKQSHSQIRNTFLETIDLFEAVICCFFLIKTRHIARFYKKRQKCQFAYLGPFSVFAAKSISSKVKKHQCKFL